MVSIAWPPKDFARINARGGSSVVECLLPKEKVAGSNPVRRSKSDRNVQYHMKPSTITGRINAKALELLEQHPEGLRWSELLSKIKASDRSFHPKTVNGCVWKLVENFPDKVYKPSKGLFRLLKYKSHF